MKIIQNNANLFFVAESGVLYCNDMWSIVEGLPNKSVHLVISDGPYGVSEHQWDRVKNIQEYNLELIKLFSQKLADGGALYLFGKPDCIDFIDYRPYLNLQSKIIWYQPARLAQGRHNYTNNYDIIAYFTKGPKPRVFNLDAIRVPQMVELTHRNRCENVPSVKSGKYSGTKYNEKGKNPGDVWGDIKQLTYKSKELLSKKLHTIQKPEKLIMRIVLASSNEGDLVLDPFAGTGTVPAVCIKTKRKFIAIEKDIELYHIAKQRIEQLAK